jgi:hypothetical protein
MPLAAGFKPDRIRNPPGQSSGKAGWTAWAAA